jgi:hypothetical protein
MLPDAQVLTISTAFANYSIGGLSLTSESLRDSTLLLVHAGLKSPKEKEQDTMPHSQYHQDPAESREAQTELWFSMPSSSRRQEEHSRPSEQSAYQTTNHRLSGGSTASGISRVALGIPSISTTVDTNKPLPPSPTESERRRRRPNYLRSLLGRPSSGNLDPAHLQPHPYHSDQRHSVTNSGLSLNTHGSYHHAYSRSMPSSPYEYHQASTSSHSSAGPRTNSAAANYPNITQYQPYTPPLQQQTESNYFPCQQRSTSMNTFFEATPPRARTFPADTSIASPSMRDGVTTRPRPHTWLSPTESFSDASQFSLFVQATTGLPEEYDPFSPTGPPQLQGSLFARRSGNDTIPLPFQNASAAASNDTDWRTGWQSFEPPAFVGHTPASSLTQPLPYQRSQRTPDMAAINRELEILGLDDENGPDDELPNYAQSQAETHERRRAEASARAMELEARWRSTRTR